MDKLTVEQMHEILKEIMQNIDNASKETLKGIVAKLYLATMTINDEVENAKG